MFGAVNQGHSHPKIVQAVVEQVRKKERKVMRFWCGLALSGVV